MLDHRHLLISSNDTVRLWNLEGKNFTIVPSMGSSSTAPALGGAGQAGVSTGAATQAGNGINGNLASGASGSGGYTNFVADAREKYLFGSCGNRGWLENGREEIGTFEIDAAR